VGTTTRKRNSFTLVEMMVVVIVLAILTAVAMQSVDGMAEQARYEATQRSLRLIDESITGRNISTGTDNMPFLGSMITDGTGFVADTGGLPRVAGADGLMLAELWAKPDRLPYFGIHTAPSDPEVKIEAGWRAYLLGLGISSVVDGWGNPFDALDATGTVTTTIGDPIVMIRSRGSDHPTVGFTSGYDSDIYVGFRVGPVTRYEATIAGRVYQVRLSGATAGIQTDPDPADGEVTIRYFGPNPDGPTPAVLEKTVTVTPTAGSPAVNYSFDATTGPRTLRAYQGSNKSTPVRLMLRGDAQMRDLVILKP